MPLDFPASPTNGQAYEKFIYDSSITAWRAQGSTNNVGTQIAQLQTASPIAVASQAARDALYPTPVQGQSVFRTDLGVTETYHGLYNASTNPAGATPAGWYPSKAVQVMKRNTVATNINQGAYGGYYNTSIWDTLSSTKNMIAYSDGFTIPFTGIWNISFHMQGTGYLTIAGFNVNTTTGPGSWTYLRAIATESGLAAMNGESNYKFNAGDRIYIMIYTNTTYLWEGSSASFVDPGTMKLEFVDVAR